MRGPAVERATLLLDPARADVGRGDALLRLPEHAGDRVLGIDSGGSAIFVAAERRRSWSVQRVCIFALVRSRAVLFPKPPSTPPVTENTYSESAMDCFFASSRIASARSLSGFSSPWPAFVVGSVQTFLSRSMSAQRRSRASPFLAAVAIRNRTSRPKTGSVALDHTARISASDKTRSLLFSTPPGTVSNSGTASMTPFLPAQRSIRFRVWPTWLACTLPARRAGRALR